MRPRRPPQFRRDVLQSVMAGPGVGPESHSIAGRTVAREGARALHGADRPGQGPAGVATNRQA
eukprot:7257875-Lingulodinium_polyedra.AAC.1